MVGRPTSHWRIALVRAAAAKCHPVAAGGWPSYAWYMGFLMRRCSQCGESPQLRISSRVEGRVGSSEVEFTNFAYKACACGRVVQWAFDPGLEFSTQLFYEGVPSGHGGRRAPKCCGCGGLLAGLEEVTLRSSAKLDGLPPIEMKLRLFGYRCPACGLEQAPPDEFDISNRRHLRSSDTGRALDAAIESVGLHL